MNRRIIKRKTPRVILLSAVALLILTVLGACAASTTGTSLSISMANREVKEGETFAVEVRLKTDTPCRGAQCALSFDPALMKCDSVVEGSFFKDWASANGGSTMVVPQPTIDNGQGHVSLIGIAVMGGSGGGVKGNGVLCTYYFTALANGTTAPTLSEVVVADASGQQVPGVKVSN